MSYKGNSTHNDVVRHSDDAYRIFEEKGSQNAVKVRRIMQITSDLACNEFRDIKILDLGCGEGVYSIEAALRGANVIAIDGRKQRLELGQLIAEQLSLKNVRFLQADVRNLSRETLGDFNVVFFLGLLYHLDVPEVFDVLSKAYDLCTDFTIIDTHISLEPELSVPYKGVNYFGEKYREHGDSDPPEAAERRLVSSLDNVFSFLFTKDSLYRLLHVIGFTTVFECHVPLEPLKAQNRITFVAFKGSKMKISAYPWINDMSEREIEERMAQLGPWKNPWISQHSLRQYNHSRRRPIAAAKEIIKRGIRGLGYEVRRV